MSLVSSGFCGSCDIVAPVIPYVPVIHLLLHRGDNVVGRGQACQEDLTEPWWACVQQQVHLHDMYVVHTMYMTFMYMACVVRTDHCNACKQCTNDLHFFTLLSLSSAIMHACTRVEKAMAQNQWSTQMFSSKHIHLNTKQLTLAFGLLFFLHLGAQ